MKIRIALIAWIALVSAAHAQTVRPYRFLLVISDQWKDPASYVIEDNGEFQVLAAALKSWGLPFDVLRLDQQRLDQYHLLDRNGHSRYGTIIWDAAAGDFRGKGLDVVEELVKKDGVGLVVVGDGIAAPEIANLTGVSLLSEFISTDTLAVTRAHFLTRELKGREKLFPPAGKYWPGNNVSATDATVLMTRGPHPFLTTHEWQGGGKVVWLGFYRQSGQMSEQVARDLLKRSLAWAQGYALYAEYDHAIVMFMDDMGTSDKTFLSYWSYRSNPEDEIQKGLVEPLKQHHAVLMQDVNTGFVDKHSQRILNPWKQEHVVDAVVPGRVHNYASTKRGLDDGLRAGVFEIQSQGWTHMLPDLDSPPGPWWTASMDGVGSLGWWTEFGDPVRKKEIPAITQRFHMRQSLKQIKGDFGVTPLFLMRGGGGVSYSWPNNTMRIAAEMGFGLSELQGDEYLGPDYVINLQPVLPRGGWAQDRTLSPKDIPWTVDAPYYLVFHDKDLADDPTSIARLLDELGPGIRFMSANEYCAYTHANVSRDPDSRQALALQVDYDSHYCAYFGSHPSQWTLLLSDETRQELGEDIPEKQTIEVPKGTGRHPVGASASGTNH
ncbi:MAG TPA: hypothetical protein VG675_17070 [Bryobacteraceae bacterium]|nr:hypothetical protein [Bryobacteraceae bacterium]